jgi:hypothetical protein
MQGTQRTLLDLWIMFDHGEDLAPAEATMLLRSAEGALDYLRARSDRLAASKISEDIRRLYAFYPVIRRRRRLWGK